MRVSSFIARKSGLVPAGSSAGRNGTKSDSVWGVCRPGYQGVMCGACESGADFFSPLRFKDKKLECQAQLGCAQSHAPVQPNVSHASTALSHACLAQSNTYLAPCHQICAGNREAAWAAIIAGLLLLIVLLLAVKSLMAKRHKFLTGQMEKHKERLAWHHNIERWSVTPQRPDRDFGAVCLKLTIP